MGRALLELHSFLMCVCESSVAETHLRLKQQFKAPLLSYPGSEKNPPNPQGADIASACPFDQK